jgi:hypothetical protein
MRIFNTRELFGRPLSGSGDVTPKVSYTSDKPPSHKNQDRGEEWPV